MEEAVFKPELPPNVIDIIFGGTYGYVETEDGFFAYKRSGHTFEYDNFFSAENVQKAVALEDCLLVGTISGTFLYREGVMVYNDGKQAPCMMMHIDKFYLVQENAIYSISNDERCIELRFNFAEIPVQIRRAENLFFTLACSTLYCQNQIFTSFSPIHFAVNEKYVICYNCVLRVIPIESNDFASTDSNAMEVSPPERIMEIEYSGAGQMFWLLCTAGIYQFDAELLTFERTWKINDARHIFMHSGICVISGEKLLLCDSDSKAE